MQVLSLVRQCCHLQHIISNKFINWNRNGDQITNNFYHFPNLLFKCFAFSHITSDKFIIEPRGTGLNELLVIDRVTQEISLTGI